MTDCKSDCRECGGNGRLRGDPNSLFSCATGLRKQMNAEMKVGKSSWYRGVVYR